MVIGKRFPERDKVHGSTASDLVAAPWEGWQGGAPCKGKSPVESNWELVEFISELIGNVSKIRVS